MLISKCELPITPTSVSLAVYDRLWNFLDLPLVTVAIKEGVGFSYPFGGNNAKLLDRRVGNNGVSRVRCT